MPKGVEHSDVGNLTSANSGVPNSVMPKGVEHLGLCYNGGREFAGDSSLALSFLRHLFLGCKALFQLGALPQFGPQI